MNNTVQVFAILNFVLAFLSLVGMIIKLLDSVLGMSIPGLSSLPAESEFGDASYMAGYLTGQVMGIVCGVIYLVLYIAAGVGLLKQTLWGYYTHIVAACFTTVGCCVCVCFCGGILYTVPALIFAFTPSFRESFPGLESTGV